MLASEVKFGTQVVTLGGTKKYVRLNVGRSTLNRSSEELAFANVDNGRVRLVTKDATATPVA